MLHIPSLQVLQYYTFLTAVVKCSTGVPLKRECEVLEYLAVLSPQYISVSVDKMEQINYNVNHLVKRKLKSKYRNKSAKMV